MTKALALENFWVPGFFNSKKSVSGKAVKTKSSSKTALWVALLAAVNVILLTSYIYGVNEFASQGYSMKVLQKRLATLSEENRAINLKISEANSMVRIQNDFLSANFVAAGTPKFLEVNQFTQR